MGRSRVDAVENLARNALDDAARSVALSLFSKERAAEARSLMESLPEIKARFTNNMLGDIYSRLALADAEVKV